MLRPQNIIVPPIEHDRIDSITTNTIDEMNDIATVINPPTVINNYDTIYLDVQYNINTSSYKYIVCDLLYKPGYQNFAIGKIHVTSTGNKHAVLPVKYRVNSIPHTGHGYILQLWIVEPSVYDSNPNDAWKYWSYNTVYEVSVVNGALDHKQNSNRIAIQYDTDLHGALSKPPSASITATHLVRHYNTSGSAVNVISYNKQPGVAYYAIADILDPRNNNYHKHGNGLQRIDATDPTAGDVSITVYTSNAPIGTHYILQLYIVSADIYDNDPVNAWKQWHDVQQYSVSVVDGGYSPGDEWSLVFSDEFDGPHIDENVWTFEYGNGQDGWGNNVCNNCNTTYIEHASVYG